MRKSSASGEGNHDANLQGIDAPEYFEAVLLADRWFALGSLMFMLVMASVAATYGFKVAWFAVPVFGVLAFGCAVPWTIYLRRGTRYTLLWYASHPYRGPLPQILGPVRGFAVAHPIPTGALIAVALLSSMAFAIFQIVPAGT